MIQGLAIIEEVSHVPDLGQSFKSTGAKTYLMNLNLNLEGSFLSFYELNLGFG